MAGSIGEAAAQGLDRGFRFALDMRDREEQRARQKKLDDQVEQDRLRTQQRQDRNDKLTALTAQEAALRAEGEAMQAAPGGPTPEAMQSFTTRQQGLGAAKNQLLTEMGGYDFEKERAAGMEDIKALQGGDLSKLKPGQFTRAITVATKRNPRDYLRVDGKPAAVETAAADFMEGMQGGDDQRMLRGLNVLFAADLANGVGEKSPHGGTIVGKRFDGFIPDPNSSPDDPRIIPTIRVYVSNGKKEQSGDEIRSRRGMDPDAPEGATGYYLAPLTKDRSSRDDAPVRSIGMREGMDFIGNHMHLVELMNSPEAQRQLELDAQTGWDPQQYVTALAQLGVKKQSKGESTTTYTSLPRGGAVLAVTKDAKGNVTSERQITQEGAGGKPAASGKPGTMQQQIDAIDALVEDGTLTEEEGTQRKRALATKVTTGTKAQGLAAAQPGGSGGGRGGTTSDKKLGRMLQSLKEDRLALEKKKDAALAEYKADIQDATKKQREAAKAKYDSTMASLNSEDARIRQKMDDIDAQLEMGPAGEAKKNGGGLGQAKKPGTGTMTKEQAIKAFGL